MALTLAILGVLGALLPIILLWMQGASKRKKAQIWQYFKDTEAAYRKALATGNPQLAAALGKQLQEMRDKYKFLGDNQ